MPQYPYLKVTERLGPVMNAQRLAVRLMVLLREHQKAGNHYLSNEFKNNNKNFFSYYPVEELNLKKLNKIKSEKFNLVINTDSMQEMSLRQINIYLK